MNIMSLVRLSVAPRGVRIHLRTLKLMFDLQAMAFASDNHACLFLQAGTRQFDRVYPKADSRARSIHLAP